MDNNLTNDQNIENLKKREKLRIVIIIFSFITIVLAILNMFFNVHILFAFFSFVVVAVLNRIRDGIKINKNPEIEDVKKEIKKVKRKK